MEDSEYCEYCYLKNALEVFQYRLFFHHFHEEANDADGDASSYFSRLVIRMALKNHHCHAKCAACELKNLHDDAYLVLDLASLRTLDHKLQDDAPMLKEEISFRSYGKE